MIYIVIAVSLVAVAALAFWKVRASRRKSGRCYITLASPMSSCVFDCGQVLDVNGSKMVVTMIDRNTGEITLEPLRWWEGK